MINHSVDFNNIKLTAATWADHPIIQNMGRFYVYDMSEYCGFGPDWEIPKNGLYECMDFKHYWSNEKAFPFLIHYSNELVGFVIIDKKGSESIIDFNMAQFFILRKFKNKGIGKYVATLCFEKCLGIWEIMVMPENHGAYRFWQSIIKSYTHNNFSEYTRKIPHFNHKIKNIFRFESYKNNEKS